MAEIPFPASEIDRPDGGLVIDDGEWWDYLAARFNAVVGVDKAGPPARFGDFLEKAKVKGHYRTDASGKQVWVQEHETSPARGTGKSKVLARHKWLVGCVITEMVDPETNVRHFIATVRGWRNFRLRSTVPQEVMDEVRSIRKRIDEGDQSVFSEYGGTGR